MEYVLVGSVVAATWQLVLLPKKDEHEGRCHEIPKMLMPC